MIKRIIVAVIIIIGLTGCVFTRYTAIPQVDNKGASLSTKNRYRLETYKWHKGDSLVSKEHHIYCASKLRKTMESMFPNVFSSDGIPFTIVEGENTYSQGNIGTSLLNALVFFGSCTVVPRILHDYYDIQFSLEMTEDEDVHGTVNVRYVNDIAASLAPIPMFCYTDAPDVASSKHCYYERKYGRNSGPDVGWVQGTISLGNDSAMKALAYAVAIKLMEMEKLERLGDAEKQEKNFQNSDASSPTVTGAVLADKPLYKIDSFARDQKNRSLYHFTLTLSDEAQGDLRAIRKIKREFRSVIEEDYRESFPNVNGQSIQIDFSQFEVEGGKIRGEAAVSKAASKN